MNLNFTNGIATINKSRLLAGVCGVALLNLLYLSQAFAAPLILNDGLPHNVNTLIDDGISLSNNTTLNIQSGASISKSDALAGKAIDSNGSTINMSGGSIDGELVLFGGKTSISGGNVNNEIYSQGDAQLNISGGTFKRITADSGTSNISGGTFSEVISVFDAEEASMAITGGNFSGGFSYDNFGSKNTINAFTFFGDLSLSKPTLVSSDPSELIYETIVSGTLRNGESISSQTITCKDFVSRAPCGAVAIVLPLWGEISIELAKYKVSENGNSVTLIVNRTNGSDGKVSVDFVTVDGTATARADFTENSGTLGFGDGVNSNTITIFIENDTTFEGDETFTVALSNPLGGASLGLSSALITISNDDPAPSPGAFQFGKASYSVSENGGSVSVAVDRVGGSSGEVSVSFSTADGSAIASSDYTLVSKVLTFADGVTKNTITVSLIDDATYEGNEAFSVNLSNPLGGATLGGVSTAQVVIEENDPVPSSGVIQFDSTSYNPGENAGSVSVSVVRVGGGFGVVTVDYNTANITATAGQGQDYQSISGTLTFAAGETSKVINVSLLDDATYEGTETFALELSNAQGGATLGTVSSKQIAIAENDPAPPAGVLQFSGESYNPNENDGSIVVTVIRMNGSFGVVSVDYNTTDLTATAGEDYQPVNGTLTFSAGETSQIIDIPLLNDDVYEGEEAFSVTLSNVKGGAIAGGISSAQVDISEDDAAPPAGVIQFSGTSFEEEESAARVLVTVSRVNGSSGAVSVDYSTADFTATAGQDYQRVSGTLNFTDGDVSKTIGVPLIDDDTVEGEEAFTVTLNNPTGGAVLGSPKGASIKIIEDDVSVSAGTSDNGISSSGGGGAIHPLYLLSLIGYFLLFPSRRRK